MKDVLMMGQAISGVAAIMGALVGGLASLASTWMAERGRGRRDLLQQEIAKREIAYANFIEQGSKVYVASATRKIDEGEVERLMSIYAVASRIRLFASDQVITEAEKVLDLIILQYGAENISTEQLRERGLQKKDPLKSFSVTCRCELQDLHRGI